MRYRTSHWVDVVRGLVTDFDPNLSLEGSWSSSWLSCWNWFRLEAEVGLSPAEAGAEAWQSAVASQEVPAELGHRSWLMMRVWQFGVESPTEIWLVLLAVPREWMVKLLTGWPVMVAALRRE